MSCTTAGTPMATLNDTAAEALAWLGSEKK